MSVNNEGFIEIKICGIRFNVEVGTKLFYEWYKKKVSQVIMEFLKWEKLWLSRPKQNSYF